MNLHKRTKVALSIYLEGNKLKKIIAFLYLLVSKYESNTDTKKIENDTHLFVICHERKIREDHLQIFQKVFNTVSNSTSKKCIKVEYKRTYNLSMNNIITMLIKSRCNVYKLIELQMNGVTNYFPLNYIVNITIFCDTTPLASFLVEYFNMNKVDTIGLQHGFYPVANNNYWKKIYRASNTKYFLAWDDVTIEQMSKYSKTRIRTFTPAGPINITDKKTSNTEEKSKGKLEKIAIYGAGIDQQEINNYLIKLINYFKRYSNIEVIFICHPSYNLFSRIFFSIKKTVKHSSNKEKHKPYDLHVVLNSSVWLELAQKGESYIRIDDLYNNKENMKNIFLKIMKSKNENLIITPQNLRIPFLNSIDSLEAIRSLILKGKTNVL